MSKPFRILILSLFIYSAAFAQQFETIPQDVFSGIKLLKFGNILCTTKGSVLVAHSMGIAEIDRMQIELVTTSGPLINDKGGKSFLGKNSNIFKDQYDSLTGIKLMCEGPDKIMYVVSNHNNFGCINYNLNKAIGCAPFNFPTDNGEQKVVTNIWIDGEGNLFVATNNDSIYIIEKATKLFKSDNSNKVLPTFVPGIDKDSNFVVITGALPVKRFSLGPGIIPYSFAQNSDDTRIILIGTNNGLYGYDKQTGQNINYFKDEKNNKLTITNIEENKIGSFIWFSTLEKGMGKFNIATKNVNFFEYQKKRSGNDTMYPINTFSRKSANELFVAVADSLPAVFNTSTGEYLFINDTIFYHTANKTTDIKADALGNLFITKGDGFYWSKNWMQNNSSSFKSDSSLYGPFVTDILLNGIRYNSRYEFYGRYESLKKINLKYNENYIQIYYSCRGINPDSLIYSWKMDNFSSEWQVMPYSIFGDELNIINFENLKPGTYNLRIRAKSGSRPWLKNEVQLVITIAPPFWQTWWFWLSVIIGVLLLVFVIVKWRVNAVRKQERVKAKHEKDMLQLEAKALRAQMNPHFIFNCMNSIKALVLQKEEDKAVNYLTTFSKLIRTIFQNSDKREITLYDEIETCKLYTQLESMRFGKKFSYHFNIDETIDLKSIQVPALIIQPFIENAIWHGIMPKEEGGKLTVSVTKKGDAISCIIDDDGIGREMSKQNKFKGEPSTHQSKGVHLTQSRLDLNNALNQRNASVEIIDKKDTAGNAAGTKVVLTFVEF
ncbi:sensor histidine kinase [Panacibacter ginsenosidivorans]|nr:histidine kinase [Panacibacter ginsenosidivorans]